MKKGILSVLMLLAGTVVFAQRPSLPVTSAEFAPGTVRRQAAGPKNGPNATHVS